MLYLFPGELENQEMSVMFQTLQNWTKNFLQGVGVGVFIKLVAITWKYSVLV